MATDDDTITDLQTALARISTLESTTTALDTENARLLETVDELRADAARVHAELEALRGERDAAIAAAHEVVALRVEVVNAILAEGRREGRLRFKSDADGKPIESAAEARLRRIAARDGVDAMRAELADMPRIMPALGRAEISEHDPNPRATHGPIPRDVLAATASQLEIDPSELETHADELAARRTGDHR